MIRIDDLNRSERYFTATILPYFLAFNSFKHIDEFISALDGPNPLSEDELSSIELITEVDFVRDLRKWAEIQEESDLYEKYETILKDVGRLAVPDIAIKYGHTIIVIEGKFFQKKSASYYEEQVSLQKKLIELIYDEFPGYSIFHIFLTADTSLNQIPGIHKVIYWQEEIMELANEITSQYPDHIELGYFKERLEKAISRFSEEFEKPTQPTDRSGTMRFYELGDLIEFLIKNENKDYFVGFTGGYQELLKLTLQGAQERAHWKVNKRQLSEKNWIPRDQFLSLFGISTHIASSNKVK
ncbi:MAG: hypothetical protein GTO18_00075 [Anaerolineales bacterium]|nr:hypothetical protein [Anaerolineales bacterium]